MGRTSWRGSVRPGHRHAGAKPIAPEPLPSAGLKPTHRLVRHATRLAREGDASSIGFKRGMGHEMSAVCFGFGSRCRVTAFLKTVLLMTVLLMTNFHPTHPDGLGKPVRGDTGLYRQAMP